MHPGVQEERDFYSVWNQEFLRTKALLLKSCHSLVGR